MNTIRRVGSSRGIVRSPQSARAQAEPQSWARFLVSAIQLDTPGRFLINEAFKRGEIELYRLRQACRWRCSTGGTRRRSSNCSHGEYEPPTVLASRFTTEKVRRVVMSGERRHVLGLGGTEMAASPRHSLRTHRVELPGLSPMGCCKPGERRIDRSRRWCVRGVSQLRGPGRWIVPSRRRRPRGDGAHRRRLPDALGR